MTREEILEKINEAISFNPKVKNYVVSPGFYDITIVNAEYKLSSSKKPMVELTYATKQGKLVKTYLMCHTDNSINNTINILTSILLRITGQLHNSDVESMVESINNNITNDKNIFNNIRITFTGNFAIVHI